MLYLSTCVGFGYGLMRGLFPGTTRPRGKSSNPPQLSSSVTTRWPTNINVVPIDYAFRPRLRDRLTLRRLALRRNPWTFGGSVFHTAFRYSCQHSHFCGLQRPSRVHLHRLTERSATTQRTEDRRRTTDNLCAASPGLAGQALQHARDHLIFITPQSSLRRHSRR